MTLNGVMALTLRYFTEFGKPVFQHITASARIKLVDQKSASITQRVVKFACVNVRIRRCDSKLPVNQGFLRYLL